MSAERVWFCWSFEQCCPHIETEAAGVRTNLRAFIENRPVSYVPIGVFDSMEAAHEFGQRLREQLEQRYDARRRQRGIAP